MRFVFPPKSEAFLEHDVYRTVQLGIYLRHQCNIAGCAPLEKKILRNYCNVLPISFFKTLSFYYLQHAPKTSTLPVYPNSII